MAWSAPPAFAVSEVVTAARMNILSDDLAYLKGSSGAVTIDNELASIVPAGATLTAQGTSNSAFGRLKLMGKTAGGTTIDWRFLADPTGDFYIYDGAAAAYRMAITATNGYMGVRTQTPQAPIHVVGAGGACLFVSANAVDGTLQTPIAAGTVTQSAAFWGYDRNNSGGATVQFSGNMLTLSGTFAVVNGDTITITLTAGGAITAQRTSGIGGTHQVNMLVMFK